jgi:hypothetical protein
MARHTFRLDQITQQREGNMIKKPDLTQVVTERSKAIDQFRTGLSLHCHTRHSKEVLDFVPHYAKQMPVISRLYDQGMAKCARDRGQPLDFSRAYWTPPLSARMVFEQEAQRIEEVLQKHALVSLTDHDDIEAGIGLQVLENGRETPISLEWTVPYRDGFFHLGVHNLPPDRAVEIKTALLAYTHAPETSVLPELFAMLNELPEVLIVFNHALWDIELIGQERHQQALADFISDYIRWIHAFEVNGFRSWRENNQVLQMAEDLRLPTVSGGDRHGCQLNTILNLSPAGSFAEFVREVREQKQSWVLFTGYYHELLVSRQLQSFAEVMSFYPKHPIGSQRWMDRVFVYFDDTGVQPVSYFLKHGGPHWLRVLIWALRVCGSPRLRPALRIAWQREGVTL